jgi:hypothetical protein
MGAAQAMKPVLVDLGLDRRQFGHLVVAGLGVLAAQGMSASPALRRLAIGDQGDALGPAWPPRRLFDGGAGGFRLTPIGSVEGDLELLVEFWLSLASNSAIRFSSASKAAPMPARASFERVSQRC